MMERPVIRIAVAYLFGLLLGSAARYFPVTMVLTAGLGVGAFYFGTRGRPTPGWRTVLPVALAIH